VCVCGFLHRVFQQNLKFIRYYAGPQLDNLCVCCEKLFSCKCVCHICGLHVVTAACGSGSWFAVNPCAHLEFLTFYISKWLKTSKCVIFLCFYIEHKEIFSRADWWSWALAANWNMCKALYWRCVFIVCLPLSHRRVFFLNWLHLAFVKWWHDMYYNHYSTLWSLIYLGSECQVFTVVKSHNTVWVLDIKQSGRWLWVLQSKRLYLQQAVWRWRHYIPPEQYPPLVTPDQ